MKTIEASGAPTPEELAVALPAAEPDDAPRPAPAVRWLTDKKLVDSYALVFPFELDGVEYRTIAIRRLTAREVAAMIERMRAAGQETVTRWPMYFVDGVEVPQAAFDAMIDDDHFALQEIADGFLPARFRRKTADPRP